MGPKKTSCIQYTVRPTQLYHMEDERIKEAFNKFVEAVAKNKT